MNDEVIKSKLQGFLSRELKHGAALADDESLFELGLDSRAVTELLFFMETTFGVELTDDEKDEPEHFEDVNTIAAVLQRKLGANR
jgi:acyl carrier protein